METKRWKSQSHFVRKITYRYTLERVSFTNSLAIIECFCSLFHLSNVAAQTLFSLIKGFTPRPNLLLRPYTYVYKVRKQYIDGIRVLETSIPHSFFEDVVQRNWFEIAQNSAKRQLQRKCDDASPEKLPAADASNKSAMHFCSRNRRCFSSGLRWCELLAGLVSCSSVTSNWMSKKHCISSAV